MIAETLKYLEPVCEVLEGKGSGLLDTLSPEQREFALEILSKFTPKPKSELVKFRRKKK